MRSWLRRAGDIRVRMPAPVPDQLLPPGGAPGSAGGITASRGLTSFSGIGRRASGVWSDGLGAAARGWVRRGTAGGERPVAAIATRHAAECVRGLAASGDRCAHQRAFLVIARASEGEAVHARCRRLALGAADLDDVEAVGLPVAAGAPRSVLALEGEAHLRIVGAQLVLLAADGADEGAVVGDKGCFLGRDRLGRAFATHEGQETRRQKQSFHHDTQLTLHSPTVQPAKPECMRHS
jgi:hypothetical protein